MAWDTIGLHSFIRITGPISRPGIESEKITRPYTDSMAMRQTKVGCPVVEWMATRDTTTQAFAEAFFVSYLAIKGTMVTAVRRGITYPNIFVHDVIEESWETGAIGVGGIAAGRILFTTRFVVEFGGAA